MPSSKEKPNIIQDSLDQKRAWPLVRALLVFVPTSVFVFFHCQTCMVWEDLKPFKLKKLSHL